MFLSIKILTIRFGLFFFFWPWQNGKGMLDRSFFMARKEIITRPSLMLRVLMHAWEAGAVVQPDLLL